MLVQQFNQKRTWLPGQLFRSAGRLSWFVSCDGKTVRSPFQPFATGLKAPFTTPMSLSSPTLYWPDTASGRRVLSCGAVLATRPPFCIASGVFPGARSDTTVRLPVTPHGVHQRPTRARRPSSWYSDSTKREDSYICQLEMRSHGVAVAVGSWTLSRAPGLSLARTRTRSHDQLAVARHGIFLLLPNPAINSLFVAEPTVTSLLSEHNNIFLYARLLQTAPYSLLTLTSRI